MARKSDGTVYIDTKMDTKGISKGVSETARKVSSLGSSIKSLGDKIKNAFSEKQTQGTTLNLERLEEDISKYEASLNRLIEKNKLFLDIGGSAEESIFVETEKDIERLRLELDQLYAMRPKKIVSDTGNGAAQSSKKMSSLKEAINSVTKAFGNFRKATKKSHRGLLTMLGTSILFSTVFRGLNLITQGFAEGLNNLVQYSEEANGSMSALKSSLTQLKNSFATAFMPIITSATPALTQLMSIISRATSYVSAFVSALSGKSTYTKAVEVQEDYAASLDKTADSAKKAQKYLSGLDEIRTFTEPEETTSISPESMFTEEIIDSPILSFADKVRGVINEIKTLIQNEDWEGLGSYISDGIVGALSFLSDKIDEFDWERLGYSIGEFLSGIDWLKIIKEGFRLKFNVWKAIAEVWFGAFESAPIETALLTAFGLLNLTPLGGIIASKILASITSSKTATAIIGAGAKAGLWIIGGLVAAVGGFRLGQWLNEVITGEEIDMTWAEQFEVIKESFADGTWKEALRLWGNDIRNAFTLMGEEIVNWWNDVVVDWYEEKVVPFFSKEEWEGAMFGVAAAFDDVWTDAVNVAISLLNKFIDYLNDKMHFEWEPLNILGKEIIPGGSMQLFTIPKIPMLATGAVIPPNAPFMAMLGDQRHGTNIEAPLSTIESALDNVLNRRGGTNGSMTLHNVMQVNRRVLYDEFIEEAKLRMSTTGRNPFDLA